MADVAHTERVERFLSAWSRKARFAIEGPDNRFSTAWAAWEHDDTIYVAGRTIGGFLKISLHPIGGYRLAFTKEFHPQVRNRAARFVSRDLAVWPKPDPTGKMAVLVASICFPTDFLRSGPPPSSAKRPYLIMGAPNPGRTANVGFFLSTEPMATLEPHFLTFGKAFNRWEFDDGTSISMVAWEDAFDRSVLPNTSAPREIVPLTASGAIGPEDYGDNLTGMLWNEPAPSVPLRIIEVGGVSLGPSGWVPSDHVQPKEPISTVY